MTIRKFVAADYPAIIEIYGLSKLDELRFEPDCFELLPLNLDARREPQLLASDIYVFGDGKIEAYSALFRNEIRALFVHPDHRGKGIGSRLLRFMLSKIDGPAELHIVTSNYPARRLYEKFGFRVIDELATDYNGVTVMASRMQTSAR